MWATGQRERGVTGYEHYQICLALSTKKSLGAIKRIFGEGIHGELTISEKAGTYCTKEDTRIGDPFTLGIKPINRAVKTEWESVWTAAQRGDLMAIPASIRVVSYRTLRGIGADFSIPVPIERQVKIFWGRTGTGKSRRAWEEAGDLCYSKCPRSKFWDGYQGQTEVVVDEFRGGIDIAHILRWLDRYPVRVEIKGSARPLLAERMWFTSNVDPRMWYPDLDADTLAAFMRRVEITHFP